MTRWKTESEDTKVPNLNTVAANSLGRKASATFSGCEITRMGSTSTGYEDVSSSISDCTSTSASSILQSKTNGTLHLGKENEYDFELSEIGNEAESFVPKLRNGRVLAASSTVLGLNANSTVTTSSDVECPSNSGIPFSTVYTRSDFLRDKSAVTSNRGSFGSSIELPSSSGIPNERQGNKEGFCVAKEGRAIPLGQVAGGTGSVYGGNATYMNNFKTSPISIPNQTVNSWSMANRARSPDPDRPPGDVGLHNIGNTCFMNSGLQCLLHTPSLVEYFLKLSLDRPKNGSISIVSEFQFFMQHAWFGLMKSFYISSFRNKLGETYPQFTDGRQHDCQEFLALMLDSLHEQLKCLIVQKNPSMNDENGCRDTERSTSSIDDNKKCQFLHKRNSDTETERKKTNKRAKLEVSAGIGDGDVCQDLKPTIGAETTEEIALGAAAKRAEEYWTNYLNKNNTVITNTFQGLFKSTVVCGECSYVSVTYEPFMYLTVPIPRVLTQNIAVTFVSCKDRRPIKVNVAILTEETVDRLKELVAREVPGFSSDSVSLQDCVVVEVVNNNVARKLDDEIRLNFVNHRIRNIYMYELNDNFCEKYGRCTNTSTLSGVFSNNHFISNTIKPYAAVPPSYDEDWDTPSPAHDLPVLIANGPDTTTSTVRSPEFIGPLASESSYTNGDEGDIKVDTTDIGIDDNEPGTSNRSQEADIGGEEYDGGEKYTCVICLGDFSYLDALSGVVLKHKQCGTIICNVCIQRAILYHHKEIWQQVEPLKEGIDKFLKCPACTVQVRDEVFVNFGTDDFRSNSEQNLVAILLRLPLDYNNNSSKSSGRLFGAPIVVRIPTAVPSEELYTFIGGLNPFPDLDATLVKVMSDGARCSICFDDCDGCIVEKEGSVSILPGTALAISYNQISREQIASVEPSDMATSTQSPSNSFPPTSGSQDPIVDIHDCLRAFSEVEHLDEQNPWYCPKCEKNQRATKTMTICRFPDCLIIQLKRFVFVEQMCLKVTTKLRFPLSDLDMNPYIAPEGAAKSNNLYDLYSCVCHYGSTNSGHYTAFSKNPVTNCWSNFNDEKVIPQSPGEGEYSLAYVLFFQRRGLNYEIPKRTEETIIRNAPPSIAVHPTVPAGPLVLYSATVTNSSSILNGSSGSGAQFSDTQLECESGTDWDSPSPSLPLPAPSYATTLEPSVMEEMNFSGGHVTLHNFPHVSSTKRGSILSPPVREDSAYILEDDGFEDDNFLDPLREPSDSNVYEEEASSQSGYDGEDDVSTSSSKKSQWGVMD